MDRNLALLNTTGKSFMASVSKSPAMTGHFLQAFGKKKYKTKIRYRISHTYSPTVLTDTVLL